MSDEFRKLVRRPERRTYLRTANKDGAFTLVRAIRQFQVGTREVQASVRFLRVTPSQRNLKVRERGVEPAADYHPTCFWPGMMHNFDTGRGASRGTGGAGLLMALAPFGSVPLRSPATNRRAGGGYDDSCPDHGPDHSGTSIATLI